MLRPCLLIFAAVLPLSWLLARVLPTEDERAKRDEVATAYLAAYARWDVDALASFYDEDSVWKDPTSAELGAATGPFRGPRAIVDGLRKSTASITDLHFRFDERFASADHVVAIGRLIYTLPGALVGPSGRDVSFDLRVVTVLRVSGGKVREHSDYSDFSRWFERVREVQAAGR